MTFIAGLFRSMFSAKKQVADRLSGNILGFGRNLPENLGKLSYLTQEAASLVHGS